VGRTYRKFDDVIPDKLADFFKVSLHICTKDGLYLFSSSENAFS
jgi:hypothetical protein